jgi:hypothetical protein
MAPRVAGSVAALPRPAGARVLFPAATRRGRGAGRSIPRALGADSPPRRSPSAAKPSVFDAPAQSRAAKRCAYRTSRQPPLKGIIPPERSVNEGNDA